MPSDPASSNGRGAAPSDALTAEAPDDGENNRRPGALTAVTTDSREEELELGRHRFAVRTFDSLSQTSFRWYFFSMFGWFASMNMQMLVRGVIVFELTGSYAALGLVSLANAMPGMVLALPGGVIADRLEKKHIVQAGQIANATVSAVLAGLMLADALVFWHLLMGAVFQGTINSLIMPARQSMIPEIVPEERLMNAVALNSAGMNVMRLAAPAAGGLMLALLGPGWVYMSMAALYGGGALLMAPVRKESRVESYALFDAEEDGDRRRGGFRDVLEGCRYVWRDRTVATILAVNLIIVLFSMPYQQMLPGFAKDVLDASPGRIGLLMSITGVGSLAGSLVIASLPPRNRGLILVCSALVLGVALILVSVSSWYWISAAIMLLVGVGQAGRMSLSNVLIQAYTERPYRGRVMSIYMLEFSLVSFGTFLVGILANEVGAQVAIGSTAVVLIAFCLFTLVSVPRISRLP